MRVLLLGAGIGLNRLFRKARINFDGCFDYFVFWGRATISY